MSDQAENDARIDLAYKLAEYIRKYPNNWRSLESRVKNLTRVSDGEMERLMPELEYWLGLMSRRP